MKYRNTDSIDSKSTKLNMMVNCLYSVYVQGNLLDHVWEDQYNFDVYNSKDLGYYRYNCGVNYSKDFEQDNHIGEVTKYY